MKGSTKGILALALVLLTAPALFAQTSGRIEGRVAGEDGAPIPGVTVTATSPLLQGEKIQTTDADGGFRFVNLPPGYYLVRATLEGLNTVEQPEVRVGIDRTVRLELTMSDVVTAEVTVLSESPMVDMTSAATGVSVSSETFDRLPMARDFYAVAQMATGAARDASGTSFYGSTGAENQYVIEGLNSTGGRFGTEAKTLNFDFIQEVEVKTGGLQAEYGRLTGGLINAITKSGGNEFEGNVFGFYDAGDDNSTAGETPGTQTSITALDTRSDYGFALGGAFVQDKLWFFAAYDRQEKTDTNEVIRNVRIVPGYGIPPPVGGSFDTDITSDIYSGKLTWRPTPNHSLAASLIGDPTTLEGALPTFLLTAGDLVISGPATTFIGKQEIGADDYLVRYDGVFGGTWVFEALAGHHEDKSSFSGEGENLPRVIDRSQASPYPLAGGFGPYENQENTRDVFKADVSKFFGSKLELSVGADREDVQVVTDRFNGGAGQRIYVLRASDGRLYYRHRYYVDTLAPGFRRGDSSTYLLGEPVHVEPETTNTAAYAQGSWRPLSNLTFNVGFRVEEQEIGGSTGATHATLDENYSPRFQFIWDPQGNGRAKLFGSWGRYYESVPLDINVRSFGDEAICFCYNFSPNASDIFQDPAAPRRSSILGGATPVDPGLKGQYIDEILLGYDYEVAPDFVIGVQGTYRELGRVIEDFLVDPSNGIYAIANPGEGALGREIYFYDYSPAPGAKATREYTGVELNLRKRYSAGWQMYASYLWSELEGNYDGVFQASTGQLDPNINSAFDYADFFINAEGKLSNDRPHTVKFNGSYGVQGGALEGLNMGLFAYWQSGTPLTAYGYSFGYENWEYFLTPRGSLGRNPDVYEANLALSYPIQLAGDNELQLVFNVFNLLDRQSVTNLDQRYNLASDPFCAGIPDALCGAGGSLQHQDGSTAPVGQLANPRATASNPDFLRAGRGFTPPRSYRFGVRFRF